MILFITLVYMKKKSHHMQDNFCIICWFFEHQNNVKVNKKLLFPVEEHFPLESVLQTDENFGKQRAAMNFQKH